jgi:ATP-binding cassette subfamily B protein
VVLVDGAIIEEGTHEALLMKDGLYKDLFEKQGQLDVAAAEEETESDPESENVT